MSLSYFNIKKSKKGKEKQHASPTAHGEDATPKSPVLDEEDERFLERLAAIANGPDETPPPLPERPVVVLDNGDKVEGKNASEVLVDGPAQVPLPTSPPEIIEPKAEDEAKNEKDIKTERRRSIKSYFSLAQARLTRSKDSDKSKEKHNTNKDKESAAKTLHSAAETTKSSLSQEVSKEEDQLTAILDQLNLSAVNNRVFSFSQESQDLLDKFKLVLKDLVNGVPTAYNDLEKLLTESEAQLKKNWTNLPPFLQALVKSLPAKLGATLAPELLAAGSEKPGFDLKTAQAAASHMRKAKRPVVPSLKSLVSAEGAVATLLRSILNFLKLRFPAFVTGTNVLMSLAVFLLLFVFWYCHKRGREVRLESERLAAEDADADADSIVSSTFGGDSTVLDGKPTPAPGVIIHDNKEPPETVTTGSGERAAAIEDMPDVLHLPDPKAIPLPETPDPKAEREKVLK